MRRDSKPQRWHEACAGIQGTATGREPRGQPSSLRDERRRASPRTGRRSNEGCRGRKGPREATTWRGGRAARAPTIEDAARNRGRVPEAGSPGRLGKDVARRSDDALTQLPPAARRGDRLNWFFRSCRRLRPEPYAKPNSRFCSFYRGAWAGNWIQDWSIDTCGPTKTKSLLNIFYARLL